MINVNRTDKFLQSSCDLPGHPCAWSPDKAYRYSLWRMWGPGEIPCLFIGLNPSTADETEDDPTIRRCKNFAKSWGCDSLIMTNLFAYRATDPKHMKAASDPIGPDNDAWLIRLSSIAKIKVAGWGVHGSHLERSLAVIDLLNGLQCLGFTKDGYPKHPLYLRSDSVLIPYNCAA